MRRINQVWPDGLYERVSDRAGKRAVTDFTVAAVEAALSDSPTVAGPAARKSPEALPETARAEPASPREPALRCPSDCDPSFRPTSPKARCPVCRKPVVAV